MSELGDAVRSARAAEGRESAPPPAAGSGAGHPHAKRVAELAAIVEGLLFLSPEPLPLARLCDACDERPELVTAALDRLRAAGETGGRGVVLRELAGGFALSSAPLAEEAARRLFSRPRTPPLTQAQAECLAIVAYLQPVARPEISRIRGVGSESAVASLAERGLIAEAGRSRFGAVLYRTTDLFEKLFGLAGLDRLPAIAGFDPDPDDERELRERLLKAGERRLESN